jgi:hypothetical protein
MRAAGEIPGLACRPGQLELRLDQACRNQLDRGGEGIAEVLPVEAHKALGPGRRVPDRPVRFQRQEVLQADGARVEAGRQVGLGLIAKADRVDPTLFPAVVADVEPVGHPIELLEQPLVFLVDLAGRVQAGLLAGRRVGQPAPAVFEHSQ